ncbi:MAG: argininosuccinate synthase [Candidatus Bathyarchaeota archaeon B24]|nr:MAG: argininosuccinate synthase [Candidatus Bathyarchaeota archaeon B24]RLI26392.1 MAG: argininosuccinate synthase [Candidatus Bathyarchaeota archaeon]
MTKVVLAYSGGLDTSVSIVWLREKYDAEVYTVTLDVGQDGDFETIGERAEKLGAVEHFFIDAKEEFVKDYVFPSIKANGLYGGKYPLSSALSRPLIARKLVEVADKVGADAVAHGCTGRGNDQVRIEVTVKALNPELKVLAPVREWGLDRESELEYARKHGIPFTREKLYSVDQNLWGRSIECGPLENPDMEPPEGVFKWTVSPEKAPDKPEYVTIGFEDGVPVSLDGERMDGVTLIKTLNMIAGRNGVGRIDHIEDRVVGIKTREVYECPAALCILEAHKDLEKLVLTPRQLRFKETVDREWGVLVYSGLWCEPLKEDLETFIENTQRFVKGWVRLKLYKGSMLVVSRMSEYSLYSKEMATYSVEGKFDQSAAPGFIEIWGLPSRLAWRVCKRTGR